VRHDLKTVVAFCTRQIDPRDDRVIRRVDLDELSS
jgi:hypothetical protein